MKRLALLVMLVVVVVLVAGVLAAGASETHVVYLPIVPNNSPVTPIPTRCYGIPICQ